MERDNKTGKLEAPLLDEEVYDIIDTELQYQREMEEKGNTHVIEDFRVGDALNAIQHNLNKARSEWYEGRTPHQDSMEYLRKIAAICVNVGKTYGMPARRNG